MISVAAGTIAWNLTAAQINATCKAAIQTTKTQAARLEAYNGPKNFANVVLPLENMNADLSDETVAQTFLLYVAPAKDVRDASLQCGNDESALTNELQANPKIYADLAAAQKSATAKNPYQRKLLWFWLDTYKRSGAGLPAAKRNEFVKLSNQLNDLENRYGANLANDATTITITPAQAASLPADFTAGLDRSGERLRRSG